LFGTLPIFLVLFIFAGLAAGVKTMLRSASEAQYRIDAGQDQTKAARAADEKEDD
jgi:ATP synthase protein I